MQNTYSVIEASIAVKHVHYAYFLLLLVLRFQNLSVGKKVSISLKQNM